MLAEMFELPPAVVHSTISKMIINEELQVFLQLKGLVEDYAKWKIDLFWCVLKSAWIFACSKYIGLHFFRCFMLLFQEKTYAKNPGSLAHMQCFAAFIVETNKRFLLFFIQQEISKTCRRKNLGFLHTFFLKNEA